MAISYEFDGSIAIIRMDDGKANVLNGESASELVAAFDRANDDGADCVVLRGNDKMFSGGIDLNAMSTSTSEEVDGILKSIGGMLLTFWTLPRPTIAVVEGHAIAGGIGLAMAADRRIASDKPAKIGLTETQIGMPVPTWLGVIARSAIRNDRHVETMLMATVYDAAGAARVGMINDVVAAELLEDAVKATAERFASLSTNAWATTKRFLRGADYDLAVRRLAENGAA